MAKIFKANIIDRMTRSKLPSFEQRAESLATSRFKRAKKQTLRAYDTDDVTLSIENKGFGGDAGLLNGKGSLWGFLGFESGSNPTSELRDYLDRNIKLSKGKRVRGRLQIAYKYETPSKSGIDSASPLPWTSKSWTSAIEQGISGLERFIYFGKLSGSRSGFGLQAKNELRNAEMKTRPYMSRILGSFNETLEKLFSRRR